ncbi:MAG: VOC family protein [Pseudomonadota bacterium]
MNNALAPYLTVRDTDAAIAFYEAAFDGTAVGPRLVMNDHVVHHELRIGGATVMLADEAEAFGTSSPATLGDTPVRLALNVEDVDAVFEKAVQAGAKALIEPADQFYGQRAARIEDPFGHVWIISATIEALSEAEMQRRLDEMIG